MRISGCLRLVLILLCGAGAWISAELLKQHAGPWPEHTQSAGFFARLCGEGSTGGSGCTAVAKSDWSAVDLTVPTLSLASGSPVLKRRRVVVPVAFGGLAYFVLQGVWFTFGGQPVRWGLWRWLPMGIVTMGTAGSVALLWILFTRFETTCTWCLVAHGINGAILLGTIWMWRASGGQEVLADRSYDGLREPAQAEARGSVARGSGSLSFAAASRTIGFAGVLIAGLWVYRSAKLDVRHQVEKFLPYKRFVEERSKDPAFLLREFLAEPVHAIPTRGCDGDEACEAKSPALVFFSDFECPHCACLASRWREDFRPLWRGPLREEFRHFPLSVDCNDAVTRTLHPEACEAAFVAEAARLQGGDEAFRKMHDWLFAASRRLGERTYVTLARKIGLDGDRLLHDMKSEAVRRVIDEDVELAATLGLHGTPAVFLAGRRVPELCLYNPIFWEAVSAHWQSAAGMVRGDATGGTIARVAGKR